ncbi:unnamed protein product [Heterobilharzia americana]|nr:unnamed protein product [Heterobilharzia americana]
MFNNYLLCIVIFYNLFLFKCTEVRRYTEHIQHLDYSPTSLRKYVQIYSQYGNVMTSFDQFDFNHNNFQPRSVYFTKYDLSNILHLLLTSRTIYFSIEFIMSTLTNDRNGHTTLICITEASSKLIFFKIVIQNRKSHQTIQITLSNLSKSTTQRYKSQLIQLQPNLWYKLSLNIHLNKIRLHLNCQPILTDTCNKRSIIFNQRKQLTITQLHFTDKNWLMEGFIGFLGQSDEDNKNWKGSIRNFMLTSNQQVIRRELSHCSSKTQNKDSFTQIMLDTESNQPQIRSQSMDSIQNNYIFPSKSYLSLNTMDLPTTITELQSMLYTQKQAIENLLQQMAELKMQILSREQCLCIPNCGKSLHGIPYQIGNTWKPDICSQCECTLAGALCTPIKCPLLNCTNPIRRQDECCSQCPANCQFMGQVYIHGDSIMRGCVQCICMNGTMKCREVNQTMYCPALKCSPSEQFQPVNECCKICRKIDICAHKRNRCHSLAKCIADGMNYHCECPTGYTGSGDLINGCKPKCENNCSMNGVCIGPGKCKCHSGYGGRICDYDGFERITSYRMNSLSTLNFEDATGLLCENVSLCHDYDGMFLSCPDNKVCEENNGKYVCKQLSLNNDPSETIIQHKTDTNSFLNCTIRFRQLHEKLMDKVEEFASGDIKELIYSVGDHETRKLCYCESGQLECLHQPDYLALLLLQSTLTSATTQILQSNHYQYQLCRICSKLYQSIQRKESSHLSKWYTDYCLLCSHLENLTDITNFVYWWTMEEKTSMVNHSRCKMCIQLNNKTHCQQLLCSSFSLYTSMKWYQICCSNILSSRQFQISQSEQLTNLQNLVNKCTNETIVSSMKISTFQCIDCSCKNDRIYCTWNGNKAFQQINRTVQCNHSPSTLQNPLLIPLKYNWTMRNTDKD